MRVFLCCMLTLTLVACMADAQGLDGRRIHLNAGDHPSQWVPVTLPYDGPAPAEGQCAVVVDAETGKEFPATVRNGEFVFVAESTKPNAECDYVVKLKKGNTLSSVEITKKENAEELDVVVAGKPLTTYVYSNDNRKPFLWPVLSEGGVHVTRDWPMGEAVLSEDHEHHKSLWTAYGDINGADCWSEGENAGYQHTDSVSSGSGGAYGWVVAENTWQDKEHKPVISETREYRFYNTPDSMRILDLVVQFTANYGDAKFGDTKEGGIAAVRVHDAITEKAGNGGQITNAEGLTGEGATWGKPSVWCDYSGPIGDQGVHGITVFDHPANLRHPSRWHVRGYGLMGANCFGLSHFTKGKENGDYLLKEGDALIFAYRIYVHSGDVEQAKVSERYADYVAPPKAEWVSAN